MLRYDLDSGSAKVPSGAKATANRAGICAVRPRFKLGQDETAEVQSAIVAALEGTPVGEWLLGFGGDARTRGCLES